MKIRKVTIQNLNSLRLQTTIDFSDSPLADTGLFAITGDTGAGKTTILDAITLAMYGRIHRNKDVREAMSYGAVESLAEVEFESRGRRYRSKWSIWRSRKKLDGNLQAPQRELARWNVETKDFEILATKTREVDQMVEDVTGLDYDRFCRSVLLSQGDFAAFLMASEKERSDLLERITGTEVYSQLSRAAFQRHKLEAEKLDNLKKEREALNILKPKEVTELKTELGQRQKEAGEQKKQLDGLRKQLEWRLHLQKLQVRLQGLVAREAEVREQIDLRKPDFERLQWARKAAPLRELFTKWRETKQTHQDTEQYIEKLEAIVEKETRTLNDLEVRVGQEKQDLEQEKQHLAEQEGVFEEVKSLDIRIQERSKNLTVLKSQYQQLEEERQALLNQQQTLEQQQTDLEKEQQQRRQWLSNHEHLSALAQEEQLIYHQYQQWKEYTVQMKTLTEACEKGKEEIERLKTEEKKTQERLKKWKEERADLYEKFREKIPEQFAMDRSELLRLLYQEIEKLTDDQQALQKIQQLSNEYQTLLAEQNQLEEKLGDLQSEELALSKRILSATELLGELTEQERYKKTVYEQQQLIANYEKDRHQLEEGKPCPLCFSTDHPFRRRHYQPYTDRSKIEWEKVRDRYEKAYLQYRALLERHAELGVEIQHLSGSEIKAVKGQMRQRYDKVLHFEERLALILPDRALGDLTGIWGQSLRDRINQSDKKLIQRRKTRDLLAVLDRQLKEKEEVVQQLEEKQRETASALRLRSEKQEADRQQLEKWTGRLQQIEKELQAVLQPYGFQFQPDEMDRTSKEITKMAKRFRHESETDRRQEEQWRLNQQRAEQIAAQVEKSAEQRTTLQERLTAEEEWVRSLQDKRTALFGDKDPLEERQRLQLLLSQKEEILAATLQQKQTLEREKVANDGLIAEARKRESDLYDKLTELEDKLTVEMRNNGFESLVALERVMLPHNALEALAASLETLRQDLREVQQLQKELRQEKEDEQQKALTTLNPVELKEELTRLEQQYVEVNQRAGALQEQLRAHERRTKTAANLLKQIVGQEKNYARWAKLNDIIGMADGKKFRVFAQGLTLRKLVYLANVHLQRLNGRYLIEKNVEEDLGLNIVDTFQADNRRSMNTLSGGERFLVSLAMALGLSDLAGKDTRIESLFIDEGFGSLDDNSLDLALDTLENLQAQGKTIGIISHVKALKERIAVQIRVRKKGSGFSEITIGA